ncbi:nucleotidyl transferase AbiEii/AbiGii toxin family protein [Natronospora cellulosivora (SeqCode)]
MRNISASVIAKLKNKAKQEGISLQQFLNLFCQEEFIRRLAQSNYSDKLILKGGFLLYSISGFTTRPTIDADYLLKYHSNEIGAIEKMVRSIIDENTGNDFVKIDIRNITKINEMKEYHGTRVNLIGYIGKTRTPFSIDFGVGDMIIPSAVERTLPILLDDFTQPTLLTYSLESIVSEKFDAIVNLMEATGRMKDFYDIYYLASSFDFDGRKIQEAVYETLTNRGTPYESDSVTVIQRLLNNNQIINRWENFCKKILRYELDFEKVIKLIVKFINSPFQAMINEDEFFGIWDHETREYKK